MEGCVDYASRGGEAFSLYTNRQPCQAPRPEYLVRELLSWRPSPPTIVSLAERFARGFLPMVCVASRGVSVAARASRPLARRADAGRVAARWRRAALPGVEHPWTPAGATMDEVVEELASRAVAAAYYGEGDGDARVFIGVAGSPGSGKSTLASAVRDRINAAAGADVAAVFPMDGFHVPLADLATFPDPDEARARRGAPFTFDAAAFVDRVRAAKRDRDAVTLVPEFDHEVHDPEEDAIAIQPAHKVILVEGNYLLLPEKPWRDLWAGGEEDDEPLLTETWFVDASVDVAMARVERRHVAVGRTPRRRGNGDERVESTAENRPRASRDVAEVLVLSHERDGNEEREKHERPRRSSVRSFVGRV